MTDSQFLWTEETIEHVAEHGVSQDDFEHGATTSQTHDS